LVLLFSTTYAFKAWSFQADRSSTLSDEMPAAISSPDHGQSSPMDDAEFAQLKPV
jgi:hypothetical protein